jgi:hypothetical protein
MAKYGEILSAIAFADARVIFTESDVEHPVQSVLNLPVRASGAKGLCGVSGCTADEVAVFNWVFSTFNLNRLSLLKFYLDAIALSHYSNRYLTKRSTLRH